MSKDCAEVLEGIKRTAANWPPHITCPPLPMEAHAKDGHTLVGALGPGDSLMSACMVCPDDGQMPRTGKTFSCRHGVYDPNVLRHDPEWDYHYHYSWGRR